MPDLAARRYGLILAALTALFTLRVAGQLIQHLAPQPFLPAFDAFQGSNIGYGWLLLSQLVILFVMALTSVRVATARVRPRERIGRILGVLGAIYLIGSIARIAVGIAVPGAHPWFSAWIPAIFHIVLAVFVVLLARFHRVGGTR